MITATMVQGTASRGLVGDLVDRIGLAPITAGPRVGLQAVPTGEALALQVPGQPQVSSIAANNCRTSDNVRLKSARVRRNLNFGRTLCPGKVVYQIISK